jgi:ribose transport system substrate-binding protein
MRFTIIAMLAAINALAGQKWDGPTKGPLAQPGKVVVFIASDSRNGGVTGVYRGFEEAARKLGWKSVFEDGDGRREQQDAMLRQAIESRPNGIIIGGFDASDFAEQIAAAKGSRITLVGWHAAKDPGPTDFLFVNVATAPETVARLAVKFVLDHSREQKRQAGIIIFSDDRFAVANAKTRAMAAEIDKHKKSFGCKLLKIENVPITDAANLMPKRVPELIKEFGSSWTYSLAINDVYFDNINFPLTVANKNDMVNVSAGDGSHLALSRIRFGLSQQAATVAEPLRMQGFQLADELNRAFAGNDPSGYLSKPILVTTRLLQEAGQAGLEADDAFVAAYTALWAGKPVP